jgi:hypothetical protein
MRTALGALLTEPRFAAEAARLARRIAAAKPDRTAADALENVANGSDVHRAETREGLHSPIGVLAGLRASAFRSRDASWEDLRQRASPRADKTIAPVHVPQAIGVAALDDSFLSVLRNAVACLRPGDMIENDEVR